MLKVLNQFIDMMKIYSPISICNLLHCRWSDWSHWSVCSHKSYWSHWSVWPIWSHWCILPQWSLWISLIYLISLIENRTDWSKIWKTFFTRCFQTSPKPPPGQLPPPTHTVPEHGPRGTVQSCGSHPHDPANQESTLIRRESGEISREWCTLGRAAVLDSSCLRIHINCSWLNCNWNGV